MRSSWAGLFQARPRQPQRGKGPVTSDDPRALRQPRESTAGLAGRDAVGEALLVPVYTGNVLDTKLFTGTLVMTTSLWRLATKFSSCQEEKQAHPFPDLEENPTALFALKSRRRSGIWPRYGPYLLGKARPKRWLPVLAGRAGMSGALQRWLGSVLGPQSFRGLVAHCEELW